jgi:4-carboxymuconolactone decarboxylase
VGHAGSDRLPPLPDVLDPELQDLLRRLPQGTDGPINLMAALAHQPVMLRAWGRFTRSLADGVLSPRDRELLVLRTAFRTGSEYEWGHHVGPGLDAGLREHDVLRCAEPGSAGWSDEDLLLIQAVDEMTASGAVSRATLAALVDARSPGEAVEVVWVIGLYQLVASMVRSLGVRVDAGLPELGRT